MKEDKIIFQNKTFVFTGEISMSRDEAKSKVILLGGRCTIAPSGKTDYLVCGIEPGVSKLETARKLNIEILSEEYFMNALEMAMKSYNRSMNIDVKTKTNSMFSIDINSVFDDKNTNKYNINKTENQKISPTFTDNMWSEKYRPKTKKDLIGNSAMISSLVDFLKGKTKFKAALLSGQPGIGKTTTAHLVCKELGLNIVEFNASDIRNKGTLVNHVKGFINTLSITDNLKMKNKVVIMDEVDGMSSDRGGLLELISIIKSSLVPIICICNDRNDIKIRSLSNHCFDLKFKKIDAKLILKRLKDILKAEGKHIEDNILNEIISVSHGDVRYILNILQSLCSRKTINIQLASNIIRKVMAKNIFEVSLEVFHKKSISEKIDLYFQDYSIVPLFVQENYLKMSFSNLKDMYKSTESISLGDTVEKMIRGANQEWSLAPLHGFLSVVAPTQNKYLSRQMDFPSWLGHNSKQNKHLRYLQSIKIHSSRHINSDTYPFRLYDSLLIFDEFIGCLQNNNVSGVINMLTELDLLKDDLINLTEIILNGMNAFKEIPTKIKSELTRSYKKVQRNLPFLEDEVLVSEE